MKVRELRDLLASMDPDDPVLVARADPDEPHMHSMELEDIEGARRATGPFNEWSPCVVLVRTHRFDVEEKDDGIMGDDEDEDEDDTDSADDDEVATIRDLRDLERRVSALERPKGP